MQPIMMISFKDVLTSSPRIIMLHPIAHITCQMKRLYNGLKVIANVITAISINTSQMPRFIKKRLISFLVLRRPASHAEVPDKNTKTGAQKCVIHLVKNNCGVVVARFNGSSVEAVM